MRLFTLSFDAAETADDDFFAQDDAGIRCENDIRQILLFYRASQIIPLPVRQGIVGICELPFHPRIDHVNDLEMIGRAHKDRLPE